MCGYVTSLRGNDKTGLKEVKKNSFKNEAKGVHAMVHRKRHNPSAPKFQILRNIEINGVEKNKGRIFKKYLSFSN